MAAYIHIHTDEQTAVSYSTGANLASSVTPVVVVSGQALPPYLARTGGVTQPLVVAQAAKEKAEVRVRHNHIDRFLRPSVRRLWGLRE
jgi:hypothetical protein